jgi:Zn-dependent protease
MTHIEIGRIAGIPIYLDMLFVLVIVLFCYPYFASGNSQLMSAGIVVVFGLLLSILLHELGHAFSARLFKAHVSHIELTGLAGVTHFERSLPSSVLVRTAVYLAGPAVNLVLWKGLGLAALHSAISGMDMLANALASLAIANLWLGIFNLMPAYPLDGGRTLDAWLGPLLGGVWPVRIVAGLGLLLAAYLAATSLNGNFWRLLLAFSLFQSNWIALQNAGGWRG